MMNARLSLDDARRLAIAVLEHAGCSPASARTTAEALVAAEADGIASHGLSRLPAYADQLASGKVDGRATPGWNGPPRPHCASMPAQVWLSPPSAPG